MTTDEWVRREERKANIGFIVGMTLIGIIATLFTISAICHEVMP